MEDAWSFELGGSGNRFRGGLRQYNYASPCRSTKELQRCIHNVDTAKPRKEEREMNVHEADNEPKQPVSPLPIPTLSHCTYCQIRCNHQRNVRGHEAPLSNDILTSAFISNDILYFKARLWTFILADEAEKMRVAFETWEWLHR